MFVVSSFSIEHGGKDSLVDEDEEEEISGNGGEEDAKDEDEEEEDDVHHLSHPDADHDVNELGDDYDILEDEEDADNENKFILRLEDGINVFDHFEVLGRTEGDFLSNPFQVMPTEEVFGSNQQ